MTPTPHIAPTNIRDYAKAKGWVLVKESARDRLYVLTHPELGRRQLIFPMDATAPDYAEAATLVIEKLAAIENRSPQAILKGLMEVGDDSIAFKVESPYSAEQSLPLSFASSMLEGVQQMLLSSVCTVLKPRIQHPRLGRIEAQQFIDAARFRHTQMGSFVLSISCPVLAMDLQAPLQRGESQAPFVRRTTVVLHRSLSQLVGAIEGDSVGELVQAQRSSAAPLLSTNFCDALARLEDQSVKSSVEIAITWAPAIALPVGAHPTSSVRIQSDYFSRIEKIRRELRGDQRQAEAGFIATVERLEGEMGPDGRRSGDVILSLLLPEGNHVLARVQLDADDYAKADQAHMREGAFIRVAGVLNQGKQPRRLELRVFEVIWG
jgi:hypothetical protein